MGEDFPAALNLIEAIAQGAHARNRDCLSMDLYHNSKKAIDCRARVAGGRARKLLWPK
jgi:hypothetical protein